MIVWAVYGQVPPQEDYKQLVLCSSRRRAEKYMRDLILDEFNQILIKSRIMSSESLSDLVPAPEIYSEIRKIENEASWVTSSQIRGLFEYKLSFDFFSEEPHYKETLYLMKLECL